MNQKKSVKGLANIAALLNRTDIPVHQPAPNSKRRDLNGIFNHTREKVEAAAGVAPDGRPQTDAFKSQRELMKTYINAGIRDAYNLGHAEALEQNNQVEKLLENQYAVRTRVTTPAVVCAVMEQLGTESMTLDLGRMATVFDRLDIQYTLDADTDIMTYTVRPVGEFADGPLGTPFTDVEEIDPTDPRDSIERQIDAELEDDIRHQVEDIEQTMIEKHFDEPPADEADL